MKKIYFTLLLTLIFSTSSNAQNSDLLGEWFLQSINENGSASQSTSPVTFNLIITVNPVDSSHYDVYGDMECNSFGGEMEFISSTTIDFLFLYVTLGESCNPLEGSNSGILESSTTYTIAGTGNDAALTFTNPDSDTLIYGRQTLSTQNFNLDSTLKIVTDTSSDQLKLIGNSTNLNYAIYSISGKAIITSGKLNNNTIPLSHLNAGVYFLRLTNKSDKSEIFKFIKS